MKAYIAVLIVGVALFVATNLDDIFILVAFFADPRIRSRDVIIGQYLGISSLVIVSVIAALIALAIPTAYVGLLGLAPIAIGTSKLVNWWPGDEERADDMPGHGDSRRNGDVLTVAAVTIANGGDNLAVYTATFAVRSGLETAVVVAVFTVMTGVWCAVAHWLVHHQTIGVPIRQYGHRILPIVLIGLGFLIMFEA